jgi:phosphonatase-like hydrolase
VTIELVVFDMAGTTVRDGGAVNACFRAALAAAGLTATPAAVDAVMGLAKPEAIRRLVGGSAGDERVGAIHRDFVERMRRHYAESADVGEVPGASDVFAQLRRAGVKVALNTGFSRDVVDPLLGRLGWAGSGSPIDGSVTSDEVARGRPRPDMIRALMACFGVADARRAAKVGDTPVDLEEGTNAGCGLVVGVTFESHPRAGLERHPHTHLIDSLAQLPPLVLGAG